jgi:excisionase family DNA binding protein
MIVAPIDHNEDPQTGHFEASAMSDQIEFADLADTSTREEIPISCIELPITVKDAARFLGVSSQTVYLWVERRRIPHLRVMGRNIRFLKSDLQLFRAQFRQEVENATTE